ncbi:HlyD family efflux transporter periplasmic adaptor subunit [Candidatus Curtissbacteria bacterium]|nr:HlyD family efflux transporter periplasmic adaptor subunit [Candidatus Curtissbacteria bacterium]
MQSQTPGSSIYIGTQAQISQFQGINNQLKSGLRNAEYQASGDNPPAQLAQLQSDIAQKQLDLQDKALELTKETSALQLKLAQVNEANYFPVSPFEGVVERVNVEVGQSVSPGTVLATITGTDKTATAQAFVPLTIARQISKLTTSTLHLPGGTVDLYPTYVSEEATEGQLYSVLFAIPAEFENNTTDRSFITIELPIDQDTTNTADPFVPIDSVHQTQDEAFVFVIADKKAAAKKVTLGEVQGSYIQVLNGLAQNDQIILSRNVIAGDKVETKN